MTRRRLPNRRRSMTFEFVGIIAGAGARDPPRARTAQADLHLEGGRRSESQHQTSAVAAEGVVATVPVQMHRGARGGRKMTRPFPRKWSAHTEQADRAQSRSTKERTKLLWPAAKTGRDLGSSDVVTDRFIALAIETNLIDARGRCNGEDVGESLRTCGAEDVAHAISWALRGQHPFEKGPLK